MNLPELKKDFYQRFNSSDNFLHFTANGLLCTLLGYTDIDYAPSLTFTLSMRIQMFARKTGGKLVNIEDTASDKCLSYHFGTPPKLFRGKEKFIAELIDSLNLPNPIGVDILYDCTILDSLPRRETFAITLVQALFKINNHEYSPTDIASACASLCDITPLLGTLYSQKGYCTYISSGSPQKLPLPLSRYKIISVHCAEKDIDRSKQIEYAFEKITRIYPHIMSVSDITPEIFDGAKHAIKDKAALKYMYHLSNENMRIKSAITALKRCNIKTLFYEMKNSQKSMERFWDLGKEHLFLSKCCEDLEEIFAYRSWLNGVIAVTENDKIDYVMDMIRFKFENNLGYQPTFCVSEPF